MELPAFGGRAYGKRGSAEGGYKEHRAVYGSFSNNPNKCRLPSIAQPPSIARDARPHLTA